MDLKLRGPKLLISGDHPLSCSSYTPFILDGKAWETVEHYVLGMRFKEDGADLGESIRRCKTIEAARLLAAPRIVTSYGNDGAITSIIKYGKKKNIDGGFMIDEGGILDTAYRAVFEQNPHLKQILMKTDGFSLSSHKSNFQLNIGPILEAIRSDYFDDLRTHRPVIIFSETGDPPFIDPSKMVVKILSIIDILVALEGVHKIYIDMVEDTLYNLLILTTDYNKEEILTILQKIKRWSNAYASSWSTSAKIYPNMEKLVSTTFNILKPRLEKRFKTSKVYATSIFIASFIRWAIIDQKRKDLTIFETITLTDIIIPPLPRQYRRCEPTREPKIKKEKKISSKKEVKKVSKEKEKKISSKKEDPIKDDFDLFNMDMKMVEDVDNSEVTFTGKDLEKYRTQLMAIGGKSLDGGSLTLHIAKLNDAENVFFKSADKDKKYHLAYRFWLRRRLSTLVDIRENLQKRSKGLGLSKSIPYEEIVTVLFGVMPPLRIKPKNALSLENLIYKNIIKCFRLDREADSLYNYLVPEAQGQLDSDELNVYITAFDKERGWPIQTKKNKEELIIQALGDICVSLSKLLKMEGVDYNVIPDLDTYTWAFITLTPKELRSKAQKYITSIVGKVGPTLDAISVKKHLLKNNVVSNNDSLPPIVNLIGSAMISFFNLYCVKNVNVLHLVLKRDISLQVEVIVPEVREVREKEEKEEKINVKPTDTPKEPIFLEIDGDFCSNKNPARWICVLANAAKSPTGILTDSEAITKYIYSRYPYADVYPSTTKRTIGDVILSKDPRSKTSTPGHKWISTLIIDVSPGGVKKFIDSTADRIKEFELSLKKLFKLIDKDDSVSFQKSSLEDYFILVLKKIAKEEHHSVYILNDPLVVTFADEVSRSILYSKMFADVSSEDRSKLINILEGFPSSKREQTLSKINITPQNKRLPYLQKLLNS